MAEADGGCPPVRRPDSSRSLSELARPEFIYLWDLDGTIADTRQDIATGVCEMLRACGLAPLPLPNVIRHVGRGVKVLVTRSLAEAGRPDANEDLIERGIELFRTHYRHHLMDTTVPYGTMRDLLRELARRGRRMAVVSNKPEDASKALVEALGLTSCFVTVLGGDSLPTRKPSPEPLRLALELCRSGESPTEGVLFGDSIIDLEAGRAAGLPVCGVGWGFDPDGELRRQRTEYWVETVDELERALLTG